MYYVNFYLFFFLHLLFVFLLTLTNFSYIIGNRGVDLLMNRLYALRHEKNMNQEQVAKVTGFSQQLVSRYESEKSKLINPKLEESICDYFGCSIDYLRGRTNIRNEANYNETLKKVEKLVREFYANGIIKSGQELSDEDLALFKDWVLANKNFFQRLTEKNVSASDSLHKE